MVELDVVRQVDTAGERFITQVTLDVALGAADFRVSDVVGEVAEAFATLLTGVRFGVGVDVDVALVVRFVVESFAAEFRS